MVASHTTRGRESRSKIEKEFPFQRDPTGKLESNAIEHHEVNAGGQENLESLRSLFVEIGRAVDIGIRPTVPVVRLPCR